MKSFLSLILAAVLALGTAFPISASEPDRITQSLTVQGIAPLDQTVYLPTGAVDVVVDTTLVCTPPEGRTGCGVLVSMVLHAPVTGDYPTYPDVIDEVASFECGDKLVLACQAGPGSSSRTFTFAVPRPGVYVLEVWTIAGFDYSTDTLLLTTNYPVLDEGATYAEGQIYTIRGYVIVQVAELRTA